MNRKPLHILFAVVAVLGTVHLVSLELALYWQYAWLDMPVHFLAGAMVALVPLTFVSLGAPFARRYAAFVPVMLLVLLVGLLWEVFEIQAGIPLIEDDFELDIALDLLMDVAGGLAGFLIGSKLMHV